MLVLRKLESLKGFIADLDNVESKHRLAKKILVSSFSLLERFLLHGHEKMVHAQLKSLSRKFDGCVHGGESRIETIGSMENAVINVLVTVHRKT